MTRILSAALAAFIGTGAALAQSPPLDPALAFPLTVTPLDDGLSAEWDVQPGYYLYRSSIAAETPAGAPLPLPLPEGEIYDDPWMGPDEIYRQPLSTVIPDAGPVILRWQGCQQDGICYAPQQAVIEADGSLRPPEARPAALPDWSATGTAGLTLAPDDGLVQGLAGRGGAVLVVLAFFGFGLALSLTPCVLPMVPIVAGMLTRQGEGLGAARGLALTGTYVVAMATAFGLLGVAAAWSGANLQVALQSPWAIGGIALVFVALALSSFGLFELQMPTAWQARIAGNGRGGMGGAAALGFGSALIVGPCVTAPLAGALIYIAQTGDLVLGAAALFALGLGQGVPLLAVGAFGPRILPRRGPWMQQVRRAFGVVFLGLAIWLAGRILPGPLVLALWSALLIGAGVVMATPVRGVAERGAARLVTAAAVLAIFAGVVQGLGAALGGGDPLRPLAPLVQQAIPAPEGITVRTQADLDRALSDAPGPALIYVTADWCVICRHIERGPMSDPRVTQALSGLTLITLDVTEFDAGAQALMGTLAAAGPPTMIFVDAARAEPSGSRLIGDVTAERLLASIRQVSP